MNVLVVAPHPDDESIGCGGAICLHRERGDRVSVVFLTSGELGLPHLPRADAWRIREREAKAAARILDLQSLSFLRCPDWVLGERLAEAAAALRPVLEREAPGVIYVPHALEWHPDHRVALEVVRSALSRSSSESVELRSYEVWTPLSDFDEVLDVTAVLPRKLRAVRRYRSQAGHFRYDRAIRGLNAFRGALAARTGFAEVFLRVPLATPEPAPTSRTRRTRRETRALDHGTA